MTRRAVPFSQLPPHIQRKMRTRSAAALAQPEPEAPSRSSPRIQRRGPFDDPTHRCLACGREFTDWGPAERHVNGVHGGGTIQLILRQGD